MSREVLIPDNRSEYKNKNFMLVLCLHGAGFLQKILENVGFATKRGRARMTSVLLVDDDPQIVRAIVPALEVGGLRVTVTTTGLDAIDQIDRVRWDALIVDLGLPDVDGKAVIRHLRAKIGTPVVVISAQHSQAEVAAAHSAGANFFLHKPFRTPELVACIEGLLPA